jgi:hypothetical protein
MPIYEFNDHTIGEARVISVTHEIDRYGCYRPKAFFPKPPVVSAGLLDGDAVTFFDFLCDEKYEPDLDMLFGPDSAATTMIREFRKAKEFHYFGHRSAKPGRRPPKNPGLFDEVNAASKRALKEFARRAYRGDPQRRGVKFWQRIASLLWNAYELLMRLRKQSRKIEQQELHRISQLGTKRAKSAERVRRFRERKKAAAEINPNA